MSLPLGLCLCHVLVSRIPEEGVYAYVRYHSTSQSLGKHQQQSSPCSHPLNLPLGFTLHTWAQWQCKPLENTVKLFPEHHGFFEKLPPSHLVTFSCQGGCEQGCTCTLCIQSCYFVLFSFEIMDKHVLQLPTSTILCPSNKKSTYRNGKVHFRAEAIYFSE